MLNIGVLALQGDFAEHAAMLRQIAARPIEVRKAEQLADLHGLIMPGGEAQPSAVWRTPVDSTSRCAPLCSIHQPGERAPARSCSPSTSQGRRRISA